MIKPSNILKQQCVEIGMYACCDPTLSLKLHRAETSDRRADWLRLRHHSCYDKILNHQNEFEAIILRKKKQSYIMFPKVLRRYFKVANDVTCRTWVGRLADPTPKTRSPLDTCQTEGNSKRHEESVLITEPRTNTLIQPGFTVTVQVH